MIQNSHRKFESFSNWILAGSGNFRYTPNPSYRESCNTYRFSKTCELHIENSLQHVFTHCNKLDCSECYRYTASSRARNIANKFAMFKNVAINNNVLVGKALHLSLNFKAKDSLKLFRTYNSFLELRKKAIKILVKARIYAGAIFFHTWTSFCTNCGLNKKLCECEPNKQQIIWIIDPHFHVIGYGHIQPEKDFALLYPNWSYTSHGRRIKKEIKYTAEYILEHVALWRGLNEKLKPGYEFFGFLSSRKFRGVKGKDDSEIPNRYKIDKCKFCNKAKKRILKGLSISGKRPTSVIDNPSLSYIEKAKKLGIKTKRVSNELIDDSLSNCFYKNSLNHKLDKKRIEFGKKILFKGTIKDFEILDLNKLKKIVDNLPNSENI